jgi:hypothetical protein
MKPHCFSFVGTWCGPILLALAMPSCISRYHQDLGEWVVPSAGGATSHFTLEVGKEGFSRVDFQLERVTKFPDGGYKEAPFGVRATVRNDGVVPIYISYKNILDRCLKAGEKITVENGSPDNLAITVAVSGDKQIGTASVDLEPLGSVDKNMEKIKWRAAASQIDGP